MYSRMGNAILKEIRAFDKEYKDKTISEDYVQWYEQDENELGVISDPQFKSDDLAEKEKNILNITIRKISYRLNIQILMK